MKRKILVICGYSGSGKTTLIKNIVKILSVKGYKIGTIKHTHHEFEIDKPGKDSYEHFHAGAFTSMIISEKKMGLVKRNVEMSPVKLVEKYFYDCDLVIVEGFKDYENLPKLEIHRKETGKKTIYPRLTNCLGIITDEKLDIPILQLNINDLDSIVKFIETKFL